jgi:hypothetical protein
LTLLTLKVAIFRAGQRGSAQLRKRDGFYSD